MADEINPHKISMEAMASIGWKFWQAALKGVQMPINPNFVPWGYYKLVKRDKSAVPVVIWTESDGRKFYRFGDAPEVQLRDPSDEANFAHSTFQYIRDKPLRKAEYASWMETKAWPAPTGVAAVVEASKVAPTPVEQVAMPEPTPTIHAPTLVEAVSPAVNAPVANAEIGHNSGETAPIEPVDIAGKIAIVMQAAAAITKIDSQEGADASITLTNRLKELVAEANAQREKEKAPHLAAGQAVDAKWNTPIINPAKAEAQRHSGLRGAFATAETKRRKEEAEAAARAAAMSATAGNPVEPIKAPEPVTFKAAGGGRTRKAREIKCANIVDQDALYEHVKNYDGVRVALKLIADNVYNIGGELPGCEPAVKIVG